MKKTLLILVISLLFASFSYAGGDDRDQELPLYSLNEDDEALRFLQEDSLERAQSDEDEVRDTEEISLIQTSNQNVGENTQDKSEIKMVSKAKTIVNNFLESDRGILIMLILFVVGLILLFNFFVREKNN